MLVSAFLTIQWVQAAAGIRDQFYKAFSAGNEELIDKVLGEVKASGGASGRAYEGALLMKKADLVKGAGEKLKTFKAGHALFEKEIAAQPQNIEFRFIRLCIQENAPKIVKYRQEIEEDKEMILANFSALPQDLKKHILDYATRSKILTPGELR